MKVIPFTTVILMVLLIFSCVTPEQALEKKWYKTAMRLSAKQIKEGKDIEHNKRVLQTAADHIIFNEIESKKALVNSPKVKDWIKVQDSYYKVLEDLGKANIVSNGALLTEYDEMCSTKKELDFKIVEYYYQRGEKMLRKFYAEGQKSFARSAYYEFAKAVKHGAKLYYNNIDAVMEESHKNGIVYYIGETHIVGSSFFLKPLPRNADFKPDCDIDIDFGSHSFSTSTSSTSQHYTDEVVVGREEVKDTSGNITYKDIYEEIKATVTTITITVTASTWTSINSRDLTGQCSISSESFHTSVSDDCEEIEISGDSRAVPAGITEKSCSVFFMESDLSSDLDRKVDSKLYWKF